MTLTISVIRGSEKDSAHQIAFMGVWPDAIGIFGAILVLASVVGITLEEHYTSVDDISHDNSHEEDETRSSRAG